VLPLPAAANLVILLTLALNGWAMWFLSHQLLAIRGQPSAVSESGFEPPSRQGRQDNSSPITLSSSLFPSLLAGLVFMLFPTMQGHLGAGHAGLMVQWAVPLYVYALFRLRERGGWRNILLAALFFVLSASGHSLQLIYVLLPITLMFGLWLLVRREWTVLRRAVIVGFVGVIALGIFLIPVFRATLETPAYADEGGAVRYSADLLAVVSPSFFHPLFDDLGYNRQVLGINIDEGLAYVGIIVALLGLIALVKVRASRWWLALALVAWILSLGPILKILDQPVSFTVDNYHSFVTLPFALVADLPVFNLARTPGRFNFTLALAVAGLAGYGAAYIWGKLERIAPIRPILFVALMALIAFEYQTFFPLPTIPAAIPAEVQALSERDDVRAVFGIPWNNLVAAKYDLYLQTAHERPLIAGQVSRRTPVNPALLTLLETTLDPALLNQAGADIVILHKAQDDGTLRQRAEQQLGEPFYENERIALFETPETDAAPAFITLPTSLNTVETRADSYLYSSEAGWVTLTANVVADGRDLVLLRDNIPIHRWMVDGEQTITVPVLLGENAFHTLSLAVEPPCPTYIGEGQECRGVAISDLVLGTFTAQQVREYIPYATPPVSFANPREETLLHNFVRAIVLDDAYVQQTAQPGDTLPVWISWRFITRRTDTEVRFVHVAANLDTPPVAQVDSTLGNLAAGSAWAEQVDIALPSDLSPGEYQVYTGWYTYPDLVKFCIPQDSVCGEREFLVGTVQVGAEE
jgi:hypothetical protein